MNTNNLLKIFNHLQENDVEQVNVKNPINKGVIEVCFWYLPQFIYSDKHPDGYNFKKEIKLLNRLLVNAGFAELDETSKQAIRNMETAFYAVSFDFMISSKSKNNQTQPVTFVIFKDTEERLFYTYSKTVLFGNYSYSDVFECCEPFDLENLTEEEQSYFDTMLIHSETVCNELKIPTEHNQGVFTEDDFDENAAWNELLQLLNWDNWLSQEDLEELEEDRKDIHENRLKFVQKLIHSDDMFEEDLEYLDHFEIQTLLHYSLVRKLKVHRDDWKFDAEWLSEFISENIGQPFKITFEECLADGAKVSEKLENQTDYALLDLASGNDDCHFIIVRKSDKDRILYLADRLNLPLV